MFIYLFNFDFFSKLYLKKNIFLSQFHVAGSGVNKVYPG